MLVFGLKGLTDCTEFIILPQQNRPANFRTQGALTGTFALK